MEEDQKILAIKVFVSENDLSNVLKGKPTNITVESNTPKTASDASSKTPSPKLAEEHSYHCLECGKLTYKYYRFKNASSFDEDYVYCFKCYHVFDTDAVHSFSDGDENSRSATPSGCRYQSTTHIYGICIRCMDPFNKYCGSCENKLKKELKITVDTKEIGKGSSNCHNSPSSAGAISSKSSSSGGKEPCSHIEHRRTRSTSNFLEVGAKEFYKNIKVK